MRQWLYRIDGQEHGPVPPTELRTLASSGRIDRSTPVRREEDERWRRAEQLKGLFDDDPAHRIACPACSAEVDAADAFCMHCGAELPRRIAEQGRRSLITADRCVAIAGSLWDAVDRMVIARIRNVLFVLNAIGVVALLVMLLDGRARKEAGLGLWIQLGLGTIYFVLLWLMVRFPVATGIAYMAIFAVLVFFTTIAGLQMHGANVPPASAIVIGALLQLALMGALMGTIIKRGLRRPLLEA